MAKRIGHSESAQMLATLREWLEITEAEHEQVQRMANASSSLGAEESNKKKAQDFATLNSMRQKTERVDLTPWRVLACVVQFLKVTAKTKLEVRACLKR